MPNPYYKPGAHLANEALTKQVASLMATGVPQSQIAKSLKIAVGTVKRLSETDLAKRVMLEIGEEVVHTAKVWVRANAARLKEKMIKNLEYNLEQNNLNAVPITMKILGFGEEVKDDKPANYVIVMPGAEQPRSITPGFIESGEDKDDVKA